MKYLWATKIPVFLLVFFIGHSGLVIDASSKVSINETTNHSALSPVDRASQSTRTAVASKQIRNKMYAAFEANPSKQAIIQSRRNKIKRMKLEKERALEEIEALEEKRAKADAAREEYEKFKITSTRFYFKKKEYYGKQPVIEISVKNGTKVTIARAFFEGSISNPDKNETIYINTFNYRFSGGLRPGNEESFSIAPGIYSGWGKVKVPEGAVFTVTIERLDGPKDEFLFSADEFSEEDQKRLEELKEKYESE